MNKLEFNQSLTSSPFHPSRSSVSSSIDPGSSSGHHVAAATDAETSNLPLNMVPAIGVDDPVDVYAEPSPRLLPVSAMVPAMPKQTVSVSSPGRELETVSPDNSSPMPLFQGAHNVYLPNSTFTVAENVQNVFSVDGNERTRHQILAALCEKLLPRAEFAEYDAASPVPRNGCAEDTRKEILETLRMWASDNTTTKVYWLNGMAGTGKTTIAYSFSEILNDNGSLGATFFASHIRADTSDVRCIIPTICLQLALRKYFPSLSRLILDVVEENPDCKSWRIGKQFQNFIVKPLTAAHTDTSKIVFPVIVLDALDECSDQSGVAELLSAILKHSTSLPVKFFITSRPEVRIKESFAPSWTHPNFILHEVEKDIVIKSSARDDSEPLGVQTTERVPEAFNSPADPWPKHTVPITLKNLSDFNVEYMYSEDGIRKTGVLLANQINERWTMFYQNTPYMFNIRHGLTVKSISRTFTVHEDWDLGDCFID